MVYAEASEVHGFLKKEPSGIGIRIGDPGPPSELSDVRMWSQELLGSLLHGSF